MHMVSGLVQEIDALEKKCTLDADARRLPSEQAAVINNLLLKLKVRMIHMI